MSRRWTIGTRYHAMDTYREMMNRGSVIPRIHAATHDGTEGGDPVFLSRETLREKRRDMGPYVFAAQMLQNPTADRSQGFSEDWIRYWAADRWTGLNRYILCDPASKKKTSSDYTVFMVIGLGGDKNYYTIDIVRDRLNLTERTKMLFALHRKYRPIGVGYEEYGMQADIEHVKYVQEHDNYRFDITALGGRMPKNDRIKRMVPIYEQGRMYLPKDCVRVDYQGNAVDLVKAFVNEEYNDFPVAGHDDMQDCQARILDEDMKVTWPEGRTEDETPEWMKKLRVGKTGSGFMGR
ncbi:MAG: hypothetical protein NUV63_11115 [Gallionella sp.]|nr:hypothetical protein [Gallionella sp.]